MSTFEVYVVCWGGGMLNWTLSLLMQPSFPIGLNHGKTWPNETRETKNLDLCSLFFFLGSIVSRNDVKQPNSSIIDFLFIWEEKSFAFIIFFIYKNHRISTTKCTNTHDGKRFPTRESLILETNCTSLYENTPSKSKICF